MSTEPLPLLSDVIVEPTGRRAFLVRASKLGLALPAATAIAGCRPSEENPRAQSATSDTGSAGRPGGILQNPNSRLDTAHDVRGHTISTAEGAATGMRPIPYRRWDPVLPPPSPNRTHRLEWSAAEVPIQIAPDVVVAAWTFESNVPGPTVRCRVGDTVEFTLTNRGKIPHSMDFHAAQIDPKGAFRSVVPGESVSFTFRPKYAGAFQYHCGSAPVLMHIGTGMYGALIVDPPAPLPPAKEFVLVQSEYYLTDPHDGVRAFDYNKMLATMPDYVVFNGRPSQYIADPIRVKVGDRVRFYLVSAGPTHPCHFHVVGEQFDRVYLGAPPEVPIRGVQTFSVPAGGGMVFELVCDIAGEFPFVNHGFGHGQKGAIGFLVVEA
jgi:nitrite reductase (NO-forming)